MVKTRGIKTREEYKAYLQDFIYNKTKHIDYGAFDPTKDPESCSPPLKQFEAVTLSIDYSDEKVSSCLRYDGDLILKLDAPKEYYDEVLVVHNGKRSKLEDKIGEEVARGLEDRHKSKDECQPYQVIDCENNIWGTDLKKDALEVFYTMGAKFVTNELLGEEN